MMFLPSSEVLLTQAISIPLKLFNNKTKRHVTLSDAQDLNVAN